MYSNTLIRVFENQFKQLALDKPVSGEDAGGMMVWLLVNESSSVRLLSTSLMEFLRDRNSEKDDQVDGLGEKRINSMDVVGLLQNNDKVMN